MRLKHNKKRNTAFLYEALMRELTKSVIKQNKYRIKEVSKIIKESFKKGTALYEELNIYRPLYEGVSVPDSVIEKLLTESKAAHKQLDKGQIFKEQTSLINKINKILSPDRSIATVHSIFNGSLPPKEKVLLEQKITQHLSNVTSGDSEMSLQHIDDIVYKTFVQKFNNKYGEVLGEGQKTLLRKYISSFSDNGLELKVYLNEEIESIKESIEYSYNIDQVQKDESTLARMKAVEEMVTSLKETPIDDSTIRKVIKMQNLVEEIKNAAENINRS